MDNRKSTGDPVGGCVVGREIGDYNKITLESTTKEEKKLNLRDLTDKDNETHGE